MKGGTRNNHDEVKGGTRMKTEEGASFLERGETNMVSHRPRKRTWTNQTKGDQRRKNLREKGPMNAVQHSPCAKSASRGGAQRSLRHHRRLQRSEVEGPARLAARQVYIPKDMLLRIQMVLGTLKITIQPVSQRLKSPF